MKSEYSVKLSTVVRDLELEVICKAENFDAVMINTADVNRPGLQLAGFYDYFDPKRFQVIGKAETAYLMRLEKEARHASLKKLMSRGIYALVVCHGMYPPEEAVELAGRYGVTLLRTGADTSEFVARLIGSLRFYLAPRETRHGVLVEVHGEGLLIMGESGIGKSETALELIKRGHRLIADDAVEIKRTSSTSLVGRDTPSISVYSVSMPRRS